MAEISADNATPDLLGLLIDAFNKGAPPELIIEASQVTIRAQRMIGSIDDARIGYVRSEAACLAIVNKPPVMDAHLVLLLVAQDRSQSWRMLGLKVQPLGAPPLKPFVGGALNGAGRLVVGAVTSSSEIGGVRARFSDGSALTAPVLDNACLLFAAVTDPAQWTKDAVVEVLDTKGLPLATEYHDVNPHKKLKH